MAIVYCSCQGLCLLQNYLVFLRFVKQLKIKNPLYFDINVPQYSVQNETVNMDNENFNPIEKSAVSINYSENPAIIDLNAENPVELHTLDHLEERNISMALFSWYKWLQY